MHTGMLWFDNSPISLTDKILKAIAYYSKKYGRRPDMCLVHPSLFNPEATRISQDEQILTLTIDGVQVRPYRPVLPGHIWIGIEDTGGPAS
jgi:hypothetical protein